MGEAIAHNVKAHFLAKMDRETLKLRDAALWDLHFGPYSAEYYAEAHDTKNWPGYAEAVEKLEEWASENLGPVWVDNETGVFWSSEPQDCEEIWSFDRDSVARLVFKELITHGGMNV